MKTITLRPHIVSILPKFLSALLVLTILSVPIYAIALIVLPAITGSSFALIPTLIILILTGSLLAITRDIYRALITTYTLKTNHIELRRVFLSEHLHSVTYEKITDLKLSRGVLQRVLDVGDIIIYTANDVYSDAKTSSLILHGLRDAPRIKERIMKRMHAQKVSVHREALQDPRKKQ